MRTTETAQGGSHLLGAGQIGVHGGNVPQSVCVAQPLSVRNVMYRIRVDSQDPRDYLWQNICDLLRLNNPSIDTVQRRVGVGRGTVQRIKERNAATRLDSLVDIAKKVSVPVWVLLHPRPKEKKAFSAAALSLAAEFDSLPEAVQEASFVALMDKMADYRIGHDAATKGSSQIPSAPLLPNR